MTQPSHHPPEEERSRDQPAVAGTRGLQADENSRDLPTAAGLPADPLAPLRAALLARAREDAAAALREADETAAATLAEAREEAEAILAEARAKGAQEAAVVAAAERARASRAARELVLTARRRAYDELRARARSAVEQLSDDEAALLREAVRALIRAELGPRAGITEAAAGVVGQIPGRRVTYRLADLADRLVDDLGTDVEGLWSP